MFVDGLECSNFDRSVFENLRAGQLTCITNTLAFWEDACETMDEIGRWRDMARDHSDLIILARNVADIHTASLTNRTAILLGCQNTSPLQSRLRYLELFWDMGLRVMQLTYNNQNSYGSSCYEPNDGGLSRSGKELVKEMNRVGMLIDLSHVGERTAMDVITLSDSPVAITHANPAALYPHRRNKSESLLRALSDHGGVLGLATYRNICGEWASSVTKWCEMIEYTIEMLGPDNVGIGTDISEKSGERELDWMRRGRWTRRMDYGAGGPERPGKMPPPEWLHSTADFPAIEECLLKRGLGPDITAKVMGGNWLRLYGEVFEVGAQPETDATAQSVQGSATGGTR